MEKSEFVNMPLTYYQLYNFTVASQIPLVGIPQIPEGLADVKFLYKKIAKELKQKHAQKIWHVTENEFLFDINNIAHFLIIGDCEIHIDRYPNASDAEICTFLLGSVLSIILQKRGILPFHASAIATPKGAVLFTAHSGFGKSTLAAAFHKKNYAIISDDVTGIVFHDEKPYAVASFPIMKLWEEHLTPDTDVISPVATLPNKYRVEIPHFCEKQLPIYKIYCLLWGKKILLQEMPAMNRFAAVAYNVYRRRMAMRLGVAKRNFAMISKLCNQCGVTRLIRPKNLELMDEIIAKVEKDFSL